MGDRLIVSLTLDEYVNKGPGRPVNTWLDRAKVLESLRCVYMVIPSKNAVDAIKAIRPDYFVKGIDYAKGDKWSEDVEKACAEVGATIRFTGTPKRSATETIRRVYALQSNG